MVWDFNKIKPTEEQYKALNMLLEILKKQFPVAEVKPHRKRWASCPWKYFDKNEISDFLYISNKPVQKNSILGIYEITRYYSPIQWQEHYYQWKTYAQDVTMNCWASAIGNEWCLTPAYWPQLTNNDASKIVACWQQFPAYTKFHIKWYWWVECRDRWWAIVWKKLDLRVWFWMTWLNTIENIKRPAWSVEIDDILFPWK